MVTNKTARNGKSRKTAIPDDQQKLAAMHFTTENLGQPTAKTLDQVEQRFRECQQAHACDGVDINDEYQYWTAEARKPGFHADDWINNIYPKLTGDNS